MPGLTHSVRVPSAALLTAAAALAAVLAAGPATAAPATKEQQELVEMLMPIEHECLKVIETIAKDEIAERKDAFTRCTKEKIFGEDSGFEEKQQDKIAARQSKCVNKTWDNEEDPSHHPGMFAQCLAGL
ncbi:hypothetical protein ACFYO1_11835 [Nocardia sp. NPDC006044]|uniref:hypothetical protein n=1 Tax=Nocardia sp. NPDC006044 TaxID=3364306 RepID=UPI0036A897B4